MGWETDVRNRASSSPTVTTVACLISYIQSLASDPSKESAEVGIASPIAGGTYLSAAVCLLQVSHDILACLQSIPHSRAPINALDDDSLLNMFRLYRPTLLDGSEDLNERVILGRKWHRERWWYKLAHVCQRWRHLILQSASHLGLCLLCTHGTPVADMLAHSPPLPLVIDHHDINARDRKGIMLSLLHRDRVRRIRLMGSIPFLEWLIVVIDDEFPMLEYLCISPEDNTRLVIPRAFQAPQLRHLVLSNLAFPIGSPLLSAPACLVTLSLTKIHPSAYFRPNELLQRVSLMPHLETLMIDFHSPVPNNGVEQELLHMPNTTHVTLPNLRSFGFGGITTYSETLLSRITAPHLEVLQIVFFKQLTFSVSSLLRFMTSSENLKLRSAILTFDGWGANLSVYPFATAGLATFVLRFYSGHQLSTAVQIFDVLRRVFASIVDLALEYEGHRSSTRWQDEANRTLWRVLLRSFNNVKNLGVHTSFAKELSRSLRESPMDLFPKLKKLSYSGGSNAGDSFKPFIDARQNAGHPVALVRHSH